MANTVNSNLQNNIIAQSALEQFTSILAPLNAFSTSFNDEAAQKGKTISIPTINNVDSVATFAGTYSAQDTTLGATQITLDKHFFVSWHITDTESSQSSAVELQRFGYQKGGDLAKGVFQNILAEITVANYSSEIEVTAGNFDADEVADLREDGLGANLYPDQCSLVLQNDYFTSLLKDTDISHAMNYGSAEVVQGGTVPRLFGIQSIHETAAIPTNSEDLKGFYCHPSALAVAMRYLEPTNTSGYISARRLTDEASGIVMGYREFYEESTGTQTAVLECVFGKKVGVGGSLIRIQVP
tara:strand:- start:427 stop:1320 length:894 start_codon:yes stop_codon:yes gene_type:complete